MQIYDTLSYSKFYSFFLKIQRHQRKIRELGVSYLEWRCFHVGGEQLLRTRHDLTLHLVPGGTGGPGGKQK